MFDLGDKAKEAAQEAPEEEGGQKAEIPPNGRYILQNITPIFPGWIACYDNPEDPNEPIMFPVVALGMVLLQHPDGRAEQTVRHLVSTPMGQIDDVAEFPNFICVVAPGQTASDVIPAMKRIRDAAASAS